MIDETASLDRRTIVSWQEGAQPEQVEREFYSTNPVREALNRLSSERLVDREDFRDIVHNRCWVEGKPLAGSIRNRTEAREDAVILATHRLQNTLIHYYEHTESGMRPPDNSLWEDSCYSVNDTVSSPWPTAILAVAAPRSIS
jgi:hypothetical protein